MAEAWQSAFVEVVPEFKNFRSDANRQMGSILGDAGDNAGREGSKRFGGSLLGGIGRLGGPILAAVAALGIGQAIGDAVSAGISYGLKGIDLAGDLAETRSAIQQVFGAEQAGYLDDFADNAAIKFGQTQAEVLAAAKTFGVLGSAAGLEGQKLTMFSQNMVALGTDLASFNNTSVDEAIQAIGAGLRGEAEPLRRFGIMLDDATLKQKALELGIWDGEGALSAQQKTLAAQRAILDGAGAAMGDFERTSGGLANQQKILGASFEEAQTKLGEALLPTFTELVTFANTTLIPILDDVITQIGPILSQVLSDAGPAFEDMFNKIKPYLPEIADFAVNALPKLIAGFGDFVVFATEVGKSFATMGDLFTLFSDLLSGDVSIENFLTELDLLANGFSNPMRKITEFGVSIGRFVMEAGTNIRNFVGNVQRGLGEVGNFFGGLPGRIRAALSGAGTWLLQTGRDLIQGLINGVTGFARRLVTSVTGAIGNAISAAKKLLGIASPSKVFTEIGGYTAEGFVLGVSREMKRADVASMFDPKVLVPATKVAADIGGAAAGGGRSLSTGDVNIYTTRPASEAFVSELQQRSYLLGLGGR